MPALESLPGKIGPYRIVDKIGEGGMGVVYLARDAERGQVALKVLGPAVADDPSARARLSREVQTMRRVRSPYVAEVLDADVSGASPYIVTRYVPGQTLDDFVKQRGPLRGAALQRFCSGLAEALAAIHGAGVVHRDLKPSNVMITNGDGDPVVIDFGIANTADGTRLTQTGIVMGTPGYLAPEVIEGQPSSPASDVHCWGSTVAFAATGRQPFGLGTFQTIFFRVLNGQAELGGAPEALMPLLTACLTRNPRNRPSARWLAAQCAALGSAGLERTVVDGSLPGPGRTLIGAPEGLGAPHGMPTAPPRPPGYGQGAARVAASPASYADLLPPVDYARPGSRAGSGAGGAGAGGSGAGNGAGYDNAWADRLRAERARDNEGRSTERADGTPAGRADRARASEESRPASGHGLIALALTVAAVALAIALPVAGTLLALAIITLLRAADRAESSLAARRSAYGARASDIVVVIVTAPWTVARALLTTALLAPLTLLVAAIAAGASVVVGHTTSLPDAGSWAAGAAVAWLAVGAGSAGPRRQLRRITGGMIRTQGAMAVSLIVSWCLALAAVTSMLSQPPLLWPATTWMLPHLPSLGSALHSVQKWLLRQTVGVLHVP